MRWGMLINLKKCVSCYSCVVKCKQEHFLPARMLWGRLVTAEYGTYPSAAKIAIPVLCNHCEDAKCVQVCPASATEKRQDGIVMIDADKCVGCRSCLIACPYQVRSFYTKRGEYFPGQGLTEFEDLGDKLFPHQTGTVVKCNFCLERVDQGIVRGFRPGIDREATPACVITCPAKARYFGDLDDPLSEISTLIRKYRAFTLRPEFNTKPSVYYAN